MAKQDVTLESVQEELAKAHEENAALLAKIEDYQTLKETVERITADNATLLAGNTELKELNGVYFRDIEQKDISLKEAEELIAEQQAALSAGEIVSDVPVITIKKKKYKVMVPKFNVNGRDYAAAELKEYPEVAQMLLDKESSILAPLD
jgi:hypothetical protein